MLYQYPVIKTGGEADRPPDWNSRTITAAGGQQADSGTDTGGKADRPKAVYPRKRDTPEAPNDPRLSDIHV